MQRDIIYISLVKKNLCFVCECAYKKIFAKMFLLSILSLPCAQRLTNYLPVKIFITNELRMIVKNGILF